VVEGLIFLGRVIYRPIRSGVFCSMAVCFAGCATMSPVSPEDQVRERAQQWLDALMSYDIERAYEFTSPAYRSAHGLRHYAKAYAGKDMWRSAEVSDVHCDLVAEFGQCDVTFLVTYRGFMMKEDMTTQLPQQWVKVDGEWYSTVGQ